MAKQRVAAPPASPPLQEVVKEDASDGAKSKATQPATARPEREANFKDYIRIFTYAKKFDYFLMVAAGLASIGAGIVRPKTRYKRPTPERET